VSIEECDNICVKGVEVVVLSGVHLVRREREEYERT